MKVIEALAFALTIAGLFAFGEEVSASVLEGMIYSATGLIPSVFPFMFVSGLLISRPVYGELCEVLSPLTTGLLRLPKVCGGALLAAITCGYPVGAKLTAELLRNKLITKAEARRMLLSLVNPGLPFTVIFTGGKIYGDYKTGLLIYAAVTVSNLLTLVYLSLFEKKPESIDINRNYPAFSEGIRTSAESSSKACLTMLVYISIFKILFVLLDSSGFSGLISGLHLPFKKSEIILTFLLEVTSGITASAALGASLSLMAFGLGFGGLCIILQAVSFFDRPVAPFWEILLSRFIQGTLSAVLTSFFPMEAKSVAAFSSLGVKIPGGLKAEPAGFICLVVLFLLYILSGSKNVVEKPQKK